MVKIVTLRNRKDFIRAAQGLKVVCNSLIIQAAQTLPAKKEKKEKIFYTDEHSSAAYKDVREEASTEKCLQNSLASLDMKAGFKEDNEGTSTEHSSAAYKDVREEASTGKCLQNPLASLDMKSGFKEDNEGTSTEHSSATYKDVREEASTGKCLQNPLKNRFHIGFTATKKLGKAHIRNRVKRRLRAAARDVLPDLGKDGFNYVLIGRYNTEKVPFDLLKKDLKKGVKKLNNLLKEKENAGKNPHLDN